MRDFFYNINLQIFADAGDVVNTTTGTANAYTGATEVSDAMSPTMKTYYDTELLENAREKLIFTQLGKKQPLPKKHGKTVEWRKWNTFKKALKALVEGVIPTGQKFGISSLHATVMQYGDYTTISDQLDVHAVDPVILGATEEMGAAGGGTADTLVRNELVTGTSIIYADTLSAGVSVGAPVGRWGMVAGNNWLTPAVINKAKTFLRKQKAPYFEGRTYVAVIHPSVAEDLRNTKGWLDAHQYDASEEIFNGEIGMLHGVRFIENTEAPIFLGDTLFSDEQRYLTVSAYSASDTTSAAQFGIPSAYKITLSETLTAEIAEALIGRKVHFYDASKSGGAGLVGSGTICGATVTGKYVWIDKAPPVALANTDRLYPGEGGDETDGSPCAVYGVMFFGKDAFGVVDPEEMGMEMIIKSRKEAGGPLEQFGTVGYKFETATKILYQERMVRVECCSSYSTLDEAN